MAVMSTAVALVATACSSSSSSGGGGGTSKADASKVAAEYRDLYTQAVKEGGTLVMYSDLRADAAKKLTSDYEADFPGLKMKIIFGTSSADEKARDEAEAKRSDPDIDVITLGDPIFMQSLEDAGSLADLTGLPNMSAVQPAYFSKGFFGYSISVGAITYNSNIYKSNPPDSFQALLDLGKDAGFIDPRAGGDNATLTYLLMKTKGISFFRDLKSKGLPIYSSINTAAPLVVSGDLKATLGSQNAGACLGAQGQPVKVVMPKPTIVNGQYAGTLSNSSRLAEAKLLLSFMASVQGQTIISNGACVYSAVPGVQISSTLPPLSSLDLYAYTPAQFAAEFPALDKQAIDALGLS